MKPIVTSSLAVLAAGLILGGCAVAPVDGSYAYGYARPYYYDSGPVYYDSWPGYYYYGAPAISGSFHFGDRDRRWGGSWRHNSLPRNGGDQTTSRTVRAETASRTFRAPRTSTAQSQTTSRARTDRKVAHRDSDKS